MSTNQISVTFPVFESTQFFAFSLIIISCDRLGSLLFAARSLSVMKRRILSLSLLLFLSFNRLDEDRLANFFFSLATLENICETDDGIAYLIQLRRILAPSSAARRAPFRFRSLLTRHL